MKKRAIFLIVLIIIFGVGISFFMYFPKSIENALNRIKYPFEVGEILASQQIDENLTAVIYTNKEEKSNLQNAIVRKRGIFYDVIETNGSVHIEKPKQLESGQLRTQVLISWYDKSDKYVIMAVAYGNVKKCAVGKHPKSEKLGSTGQAACCARIHSRYFTGGNPSGLRV